MWGAFFSGTRVKGWRFETFFSKFVTDPARTLIVVYSHGTSYNNLRFRCQDTGPPPFFRDRLAGSDIEGLRLIVFYHCSFVRGGAHEKHQQWRVEELGWAVDTFLAHGVPARHIVLSGGSLGATISLVYATQHPGKVNSVIAFAPGNGIGYLYAKESYAVEMRQSLWQAALKGLDVPALVYGFEGDRFAPIGDLTFLSRKPSVDLKIIRKSDGKISCGSNPHACHGAESFVTSELPYIKQFLRRQVIASH